MNKSNNNLFFYMKEMIRSRLDDNYVLNDNSPRKLLENQELVIKTLIANPYFLETLPDDIIFSDDIYIKIAIENGYRIEKNSKFIANEKFILKYMDISGKIPNCEYLDRKVFQNQELKQKFIELLKVNNDLSSAKQLREDKEFAIVYYEILFFSNIDLSGEYFYYPAEGLMCDPSFVEEFMNLCIAKKMDDEKIWNLIIEGPGIKEILKTHPQIVDLIFNKLKPQNLKKFFELIFSEKELETFFTADFTGILEELKQIYTINPLAPYTLDGRLLGKGIPAFKLQQYAGDAEFQNKLINLSPDKFMLFLLLSKRNLSKTNNWNRLDSNMLENLSSTSYDKFLEVFFEHIKRNEIANYEFDNLSQILSETPDIIYDGVNSDGRILRTNTFNITVRQELQAYDVRRWEICNRIIANPYFENYENLDGNPMDILNQYEPIDRLKFAILQKIFGMNLKDAEIILKNFGENIETFDSINEENEDIIEEIRAICNILNCDDIELLQEIGKQLEFVNLDVSHGPLIFEEAKRVFENNIKNNLYSPCEKDYIRSYDNIKVYQMPLEFEAITKFIGAKSSKKIYENSLSGDRFRRRTCTSYITGSLLLPANDSNRVHFGFGQSMADFHFGGMYLNDAASSMGDIVYSAVDEESSSYQDKDDLVANTDSKSFLRNEIIVETLILDQKTGSNKKLMPEYIIYYQQKSNMSEDERINDINFQNALATAKEFGIPVVIIDCEAIRNNELKKIYEGIKSNYNDYKSVKKLVGQIKNYIARYGDSDILNLITKEEIEALEHFLDANKPQRKFDLSKYKVINKIVEDNTLEGDVAIAK